MSERPGNMELQEGAPGLPEEARKTSQSRSELNRVWENNKALPAETRGGPSQQRSGLR